MCKLWLLLCRNAKKGNKVSKYNHGKKSMKVQFIIYDDMDTILKEMGTCHNNPKKATNN